MCNSGRKPHHILALKAIFSHVSLGQTSLMNVQCHRELCELGCTLPCKTDFWWIFVLFRLKSRHRFIAFATVLGRKSRSGVRESWPLESGWVVYGLENSCNLPYSCHLRINISTHFSFLFLGGERLTLWCHLVVGLFCHFIFTCTELCRL